MAGPAPAEIEIPIVAKKPEADASLPTTSAHIEEKSVSAITEALNTAGHNQTPQQVSAGGEAEQVLSNLEKEGAAERVADTAHHIKRIGEDWMRGLQDSTHDYSAEDKPKGHFGVLGRAWKMAKERGKSVIVKNPLRTGKWK